MKNTALIAARVKLGLIQRQVAKRVGIDASRLSLIENGHIEATKLERVVLARVLETTEEELFSGLAQQPSEVQ